MRAEEDNSPCHPVRCRPAGTAVDKSHYCPRADTVRKKIRPFAHKMTDHHVFQGMFTIHTPQLNWNDIETVLPTLPRFRMVSPKKLGLAECGDQQVIVREVDKPDETPALSAIVSRKYKLLQHEEVLHGAAEWTRKFLGVDKPKVHVSLADYGRRAEFHIGLAPISNFAPDGFPIQLNMVCSNSVDGRSSFRMGLRWLRLVCSNGMMAGVSLASSRAHRRGLGLEKALGDIAAQIDDCRKDAEGVRAWVDHPMPLGAIALLANGVVARRWGSSAATRLWHICQSGCDVKTIPPYTGDKPTEQNVRYLGAVPGAPKQASNVFDVAQALSWIASREGDFDTVATRQAEIGHILRSFLPAALAR